MKTRVANLMLVTLMIAASLAQPSTAIATSSTRRTAVTARTPSDRAVRFEIVLNAPVERVWDAWTTRDGIKSFFAPDCDIDVRVLGKYNILFDPSAPAGLRGAEGNLILAIQEGKLFSFTWDAPPNFPSIRQQRTSVVIRLAQLGRNKTKLSFTQSGWGEGDEWNKVYDYFVMAWGDVVLPFLKHSLETGPIDWENPPQKLPKARLIAD
ncbi:MAG: SRPBCC family protein [Pyrinomonadaceae bacterium]